MLQEIEVLRPKQGLEQQEDIIDGAVKERPKDAIKTTKRQENINKNPNLRVKPRKAGKRRLRLRLRMIFNNPFICIIVF
jgi:hypothetical protein